MFSETKSPGYLSEAQPVTPEIPDFGFSRQPTYPALSTRFNIGIILQYQDNSFVRCLFCNRRHLFNYILKPLSFHSVPELLSDQITQNKRKIIAIIPLLSQNLFSKIASNRPKDKGYLDSTYSFP